MTIDYDDDRDEVGAVSDDDIVSVEKCYLACLMRAAEEQVDFEDHGDFVVVVRGDSQTAQSNGVCTCMRNSV
jgi:hypothetical protein